MTERPAAPDFAFDAVGHGCFAIDADGQVQAFVPSIRDRLIERGVLCRGGDSVWRLAWHGFDLDRERAMDMSCCDFCGEHPVTWLVPCSTFSLPSVPGVPEAQSISDWTACERCGTLILATRKADLLRRCQQLGAYPSLSDAAQRRALWHYRTVLHQRFWRHYRGGATRIASPPYGH